MGAVFIWIIAALLVFVGVIGVLILWKQDKLDAPYGGIIVVEKQDGEPALVYLKAVTDPANLVDGQDLKVKIRVQEAVSQGKH